MFRWLLMFTLSVLLTLPAAAGSNDADDRASISVPVARLADEAAWIEGHDRIALGLLQDTPETPAVSPFRRQTLITFRPHYWNPSLEGSMSLVDDFGFSTNLDFEDDLSVDDPEDHFAWEVGILFGPSFLRVSGYSYESSALETANQNITFGDITIPLGDMFHADLDVTDIKIQAGWALFNLKDHGFTLALTVGVDIFQIESSIEDATTLLKDSIDEDLPLPIIGVHVEIPVDRFLITAEVAGFSLEVQDIDFSYLDASVSLTWMPIDHVGVFGGYRLIDFDLDSSDFDLDADLSGPFLGVEIRF